MRQYVLMIVWLLAALAAVVGLSYALSHLGIAQERLEPRLVADWLLSHGIRIVLIVAFASGVVRASTLAIRALQNRLGYGHAVQDLEWQRRASTLGGILTRLVTVAVWFVAGMMVLRELTIDVVPILTGAGIAGLAIGFGAQNLVRDVISGFFMILEDQARVGDIARINGVAGSIEQVNLRTIVLRDGEGAVHVFPSGTVNSLANLSKQYSFAIVDLRVSFAENLDRVFGTIQEVGAAMQNDSRWGPSVLGPLEIVGVESLDETTMTIRSKFRTQPLNQGRVANELRKRLLVAMVGRGIKPYGNR